MMVNVKGPASGWVPLHFPARRQRARLLLLLLLLLLLRFVLLRSLERRRRSIGPSTTTTSSVAAAGARVVSIITIWKLVSHLGLENRLPAEPAGALDAVALTGALASVEGLLRSILLLWIALMRRIIAVPW